MGGSRGGRCMHSRAPAPSQKLLALADPLHELGILIIARLINTKNGRHIIEEGAGGLQGFSVKKVIRQ